MLVILYTFLLGFNSLCIFEIYLNKDTFNYFILPILKCWYTICYILTHLLIEAQNQSICYIKTTKLHFHY